MRCKNIIVKGISGLIQEYLACDKFHLNTSTTCLNNSVLHACGDFAQANLTFVKEHQESYGNNHLSEFWGGFFCINLDVSTFSL